MGRYLGLNDDLIRNIRVGQLTPATSVQLNVSPQGIDQLRKHAMRHHHASYNLVRSPQVLDEIEYELRLSRHHDNSGAETTHGYVVWHPGTNWLLRGIGAIVRMKAHRNLAIRSRKV